MDKTDRALTESLGRAVSAETGCVLRVIDGEDAGKQLAVHAGKVTLGTREDADLQLTDRSVSGMHLSIEVVPEGLLATDLGSTNGTFYLGTRLEKGVLARGAVLTLGRTRILLASPAPRIDEDHSS